VESMNWLRLGAIAALVLGSIYVLLPTALQQESDAQLEAAKDVVGLEEQSGRLPLTVTRGDRDEVIEALRQRIAVADIEVEGVEADGEDHLVVELGDATFDNVNGLLAEPGQAVVVDLAALEAEPTDEDAVSAEVAAELEEAGVDVDAPSKKLGALLRAPDIDEVAFLQLQGRPVMGVSVGDGGELKVVLAPSEDQGEDPAVRVVLLNRVPAGVVLEDEQLVPLTADTRYGLARLVSLGGAVESKRGRADDDQKEGIHGWSMQ